MVAAPETQVTFPPFECAHLLDRADHGDWRDALATDGFHVVKGAIPSEKALEYRERALSWQEGFGLGFKRDDSSTFVVEKLPVNMKGGMIHGYALSHESWVWEVRAEPGVAAAFAHLWGTDELVTSFDAACIMLPGRKDVKDDGKWEHMDQSPSRKGFYCCQGIVNLNENGPKDGGLMVLKGSSQLVEEYFDEVGREVRTWGPVDWYGFTAEQQDWFYARGCEWVKVEAEPGDLILWDSRAMHYNVRPSGDRDRVCTYVCMAPSRFLSEADRTLRAEAFARYRGTVRPPPPSCITQRTLRKRDTHLRPLPLY